MEAVHQPWARLLCTGLRTFCSTLRFLQCLMGKEGSLHGKQKQDPPSLVFGVSQFPGAAHTLDTTLSVLGHSAHV